MTTIAVEDRALEYQARLAQLWEKNLGVPVSGADDYFRAGGDSLRATQLMGWIREGFGTELSLLDLFESRTLAAQAELLLARAAESTERARPSTEYRYFGERRLFGALHRPGGRARGGVVLCYPMGQEYMRIHRTYVELARSLAASGFAALRFDYYGCGDSAGDDTDGDFAQWRDDIADAIRELRAQSGVRDIHLVGSRIGANLALDVARGGEELAGLVLWEPIVDGAEYLRTLKRAHRDLLHNNARLDGYERRELRGCAAEFLGYPMTRTLYEQVAAVSLPAAPAGPLPDVLVLANSNKPALEDYAAAQAGRDGSFEYVCANESDGIWLKEDRQNKGLIPAQAVQAVVSWIARRAA
jgi:pimeloyl-ACP methyl ester carboxylesterase/aryl carrier-like protein